MARHKARAWRIFGPASSAVQGFTDKSFDVVLANPPYYAQNSIAFTFMERGRDLLKPAGRFFLVTRQPQEVGELAVDIFGDVEAAQRRGYWVLCAHQR